MADLSVDVYAAPWKQDARYLRDEPLVEPWRDAMEENRRKLDEDLDSPGAFSSSTQTF